MIKNNFNTQAYKTPVCKTVHLHIEGAFIDTYSSGTAGYWSNDDDNNHNYGGDSDLL